MNKTQNNNRKPKSAGTGFAAFLIVVSLAAFSRADLQAEPASRDHPEVIGDLWDQDNLVAWCAVPFDVKKRGPEERALMLRRLGFKHFAYDWRKENIPTFDAEIEALQKHGIDLLAWWFPLGAEHPLAKTTLEVFQRHNVHPQLWVSVHIGWPESPDAQAANVKTAADRINALVKLATPFGCSVQLYNHNGWFGMVENQVAVIDRLAELGVTGVGMVYNFSHVRDEKHDDTVDFQAIWKKIQPHVVVVNITGTQQEGIIVYPSQGDCELEMMRIIQQSGWKGRIGVIAEKGGDTETTLANYLKGLAWLAKEVTEPGAGGPRPSFAQ